MFGDYDLTLMMLLFMRMTGCIIFNPIFSRKNVPVLLRVGLTLALTYFTYGLLPPQDVGVTSPLIMMLLLLKELMIGLMIGFIINMFMSIIIMAGEAMDMQMGISMSKVYDPASNISMPLSASFYNVLFVLMFFMTNSHLTLMRVFVTLGYILPYGEMTIPKEAFEYLGLLFSQILVFAVKMTLPVMATELIAEFGIGLMMKAVPQINIFVVNMQLKVLLGFLIMLLLVSPIATYFENLINYMFDDINKLIGMFSG